MINSKDLYEQDICLWAAHTAELLRSHRWDDLDLEHLIEEVEDLSKQERDLLLSCLKNLMMHLLKWKYQPTKQCSSWEITINRERLNIQDFLEDTPSLKQFLSSDEWIEKTYKRARRNAANETGLPLSTFPPDMPFTLSQVFDESFWPC